MLMKFKNDAPLWRAFWQFSKMFKFSIESPYDPAILLLCTYPRTMKTCVHKNLALMILVVLLLMTKRWGQLKYPLTDVSMNKMWYTMKYYSAIRRNDVLIYIATWMNIIKHYATCKKLITKHHIWSHLSE